MHLFGSRAMDAGSAVIATVAAWCAGSGPAAGGMDASGEKMERYSFGCEKKEANCCISPVPPFSPCFHPLDPYVSNATHGALLLHCKSFALMYVMSSNAMCTYIFHVGKPQACHLLLPSFSLFSLLLAYICPRCETCQPQLHSIAL